MTATVEGKEVKVGDVVGFKSDIEQYGIIQSIRRQPYTGRTVLTLTPADGRFHGEYLNPTQPTTEEDADRCWVE